ncbi:RNA-guided endonuclease InsQ/TnpB family protein [Roseofilum casamattae]|uniref:Transposase n=1 Tax=Roseofilum casamattae BLCC-M143 TaxID=3022442 RepID=A0ABT7C2U3_9CYAN|nr:transposase [Roseofilum casamattae]MDJ1185746.1 transposase [Roseofilum casamattae BLCC-M143]
MLVYEAKLKGKQYQYGRLNEAIRTGLFIRNSCLRYWEDGQAKSRYDLYKYVTKLAKDGDFPWAGKLNSQARQAMAERAWAAISRFFDNCKKQIPGKKGYPKYKKNRQNHGSVEYKVTGWKLSENRDRITFTDGFKAGEFKLYGSRDLNYYQLEQIKRVRVVRRADGYYAQFCIDHNRIEEKPPTGKTIGLDVGISAFYTDSDGKKVVNPKYLRKSEKSLKRLQKRVSRKFLKGQPQSNSYKKAKQKLAKKHLKVSRQRKDFAVKLARCVVESNDLVAYEELKVRNLVKNHCLAKSISDASWAMFRTWIEYFGKVFGRETVAVPPHYTSQNCSNCGTTVKKSLSTRTHKCKCGTVLDRDENAAVNILKLGLRTVGHTETLQEYWIDASGQLALFCVDESQYSKVSG